MCVCASRGSPAPRSWIDTFREAVLSRNLNESFSFFFFFFFISLFLFFFLFSFLMVAFRGFSVSSVFACVDCVCK